MPSKCFKATVIIQSRSDVENANLKCVQWHTDMQSKYIYIITKYLKNPLLQADFLMGICISIWRTLITTIYDVPRLQMHKHM